MNPASDDAAMVERGREVLRIEAAAVEALVDRLDGAFARACRTVAEARGRVIVSGLGKSGHVARKVAATLTSTGTPATFLHPVESLHGDIGIVGPADVALLFSKSGSVSEMGGLVDHLLRLGVTIVAVTGSPDSALARHAEVVLDVSVAEEACPHDLAPTSSTTAALALGDALAVVVLERKGFRPEDFARLHPGGALGRKLTVRVADVMIRDALPSVREDGVLRECIVPLAEKRGTVPVLDGEGRLEGVITAGDLTRAMERDANFLSLPVSQVMTRAPKTAREDELGSAAVRRMEEHGIMALPVIDHDGSVVGMVHLHDLMKSGAV